VPRAAAHEEMIGPLIRYEKHYQPPAGRMTRCAKSSSRPATGRRKSSAPPRVVLTVRKPPNDDGHKVLAQYYANIEKPLLKPAALIDLCAAPFMRRRDDPTAEYKHGEQTAGKPSSRLVASRAAWARPASVRSDLV